MLTAINLLPACMLFTAACTRSGCHPPFRREAAATPTCMHMVEPHSCWTLTGHQWQGPRCLSAAWKYRYRSSGGTDNGSIDIAAAAAQTHWSGGLLVLVLDSGPDYAVSTAMKALGIATMAATAMKACSCTGWRCTLSTRCCLCCGDQAGCTSCRAALISQHLLKQQRMGLAVVPQKMAPCLPLTAPPCASACTPGLQLCRHALVCCVHSTTQYSMYRRWFLITQLATAARLALADCCWRGWCFGAGAAFDMLAFCKGGVPTQDLQTGKPHSNRCGSVLSLAATLHMC
jgi:hypothetical protein